MSTLIIGTLLPKLYLHLGLGLGLDLDLDLGAIPISPSRELRGAGGAHVYVCKVQ